MKEILDLEVGQIIGDKDLAAKVIHFTNECIRLEILLVNDKYYRSYVTVGEEYDVNAHEPFGNGDMKIFEFSPDQLNRTSSQLLLYYETGLGWSFDLDT